MRALFLSAVQRWCASGMWVWFYYAEASVWKLRHCDLEMRSWTGKNSQPLTRVFLRNWTTVDMESRISKGESASRRTFADRICSQPNVSLMSTTNNNCYWLLPSVMISAVIFKTYLLMWKWGKHLLGQLPPINQLSSQWATCCTRTPFCAKLLLRLCETMWWNLRSQSPFTPWKLPPNLPQINETLLCMLKPLLLCVRKSNLFSQLQLFTRTLRKYFAFPRILLCVSYLFSWNILISFP